MSKKILLIEDDFMLRENICEILTTEGFLFDSAVNGKEGLDKIKEFGPDLIICDIMMPVMGGFEVLNELSKDPDLSAIPFIFLTAKVEPDSLRKGMRLGADDYLFKPFEMDELLASINTRLRKKDVNESVINGIREQISAKIPHELRTPLVPILGYAEMIEEEQNIDVVKAMVKIIKKSGMQLRDKIEKFIIYKELLVKESDGKNTGNLKKTILNEEFIINIIKAIPSDLKPLDRIKINIEHSVIRATEQDLHILLKELLENAFKYSSSEKPVLLQGYLEGTVYKLIIKDSGRGIPEVNLKKIAAYNKFGDEKLSETGLGLGLAIAKKIIERNEAQLIINSEVNNYTSVEILFKG